MRGEEGTEGWSELVFALSTRLLLARHMPLVTAGAAGGTVRDSIRTDAGSPADE